MDEDLDVDLPEEEVHLVEVDHLEEAAEEEALLAVVADVVVDAEVDVVADVVVEEAEDVVAEGE